MATPITFNYRTLRAIPPDDGLTIPPPPPNARTVDRSHPLSHPEPPPCWGVWWPDAVPEEVDIRRTKRHGAA